MVIQIYDKLIDFRNKMNDKFVPNRFGHGHWSEVEFIRKCLVEIHGGVVNRVGDHNTPSIRALLVANCSNDAQNYPTYIYRYVKNTKGSKCTIEKVFRVEILAHLRMISHVFYF